jgi:predicted RNase H-like HicB family nuclease
MSPLAYRVVIEPLSPADGGGYFATVPDLPGCMSDGETAEEALLNVQDAILAWIEAATELGRAVPRPTRTLTAAE